jgi:predicted transcriptional regulator
LPIVERIDGLLSGRRASLTKETAAVTASVTRSVYPKRAAAYVAKISQMDIWTRLDLKEMIEMRTCHPMR